MGQSLSRRGRGREWIPAWRRERKSGPHLGGLGPNSSTDITMICQATLGRNLASTLGVAFVNRHHNDLPSDIRHQAGTHPKTQTLNPREPILLRLVATSHPPQTLHFQDPNSPPLLIFRAEIIEQPSSPPSSPPSTATLRGTPIAHDRKVASTPVPLATERRNSEGA